MRQITLNELKQISGGLDVSQKARLITDTFCAIGDAILMGTLLTINPASSHTITQSFKYTKLLAPAAKLFFSYLGYEAGNLYTTYANGE